MMLIRNKLVTHLQYHFNNPNYLYFFLSLLFLILTPPIASLFKFGDLVLDVTYGFVILMSAIYNATNLKKLTIYLLLGVVLFLLFLYGNRQSTFGILNPILTLIFFSLIFWELVTYILQSKEITVNDVFAAISGYLILGIVFSPLFFLINSQLPNSFTLDSDAEFYELLYFSFITLTTVGFGDISPIHPIARSLTLVLGIIGQLYLTILIGIIIGKYLAGEQTNKP